MTTQAKTATAAEQAAPGQRHFGSTLAAVGLVVGALLIPLAVGFTVGGHQPVQPAGVVATCSEGDCETGDCASCPNAVATKSSGPQVAPSKCVGCAKCVKVAPKTFAMDPRSGKAYVRDPKGDAPATIARAAAACPTGAIKK